MFSNTVTSVIKSPLTSVLHSNTNLWTPMNKIGALWLDGDLSTMVDNGAGLVSQWNDKFGSGNYAAQHTGSIKPSNTGTLNNLPTMVFNEDCFTMDTQITDIRTVIVVTDALNGSNGFSNVSSLFSGTDNSYTFINSNTSDVDYDVSLDGNGSFSGTAKWCGNTGVSGGNIDLGNTDAENKGPSVWAITFDQAIRINAIGNLFATAYLIGNIASLRAFTEVLTADEIEKQEGFEGHRYNLLNNFPESHVYKYNAPTI